MPPKHGYQRRRKARSPSTLLYLSFLFVFASLAATVVAARVLNPAAGRPGAGISASAQGTREAPPADAVHPPAGPAASAPPAAPPAAPGAVAPAARPPTVKRPVKGRLVFVIDDAGHNAEQIKAFLNFPGPLTIAVLPGLPYTAKVTQMARAAGKELILHQPMEAIQNLDAGPGAITAGMDEGSIRRQIRENLSQVPGAVGMNNHMGSKATGDVRIMSIVLDEARRAGIYFLDSLTIGDSVVHSVASLMKLPAWERTVFLDNTPDRASIIKYVTEGTKVAEKRGYAVMIGHVWSAELAQTLSDLYPQLIEQGFSLSTISRIMMESDDEDIGD